MPIVKGEKEIGGSININLKGPEPGLNPMTGREDEEKE